MNFILFHIIALSFFGFSYEEEKKVDITEMYKNPLSHGNCFICFQNIIFSGFGDDIDWIPWENAIETALDRNKPIFLLIHKTWCHACKGNLKKILLNFSI